MNIYSVIITFNPNFNVINLINALKCQNVTPVIVDNGSKKFDFGLLEKDNHSQLIKLKDNLGIATAQNTGIERALELGAEYILFFDQDSTIPDNFVQDMMDDYQLISNQNIKIGALGPRFIDERYNFYYKTISISKHGLRTKHDVSNLTVPLNSTLLISSGSLISVDTLQKVGFMRDEYFIDYVDTEWCLRAESLGFQNYISAKAVMKHTIGDNVIKVGFFNIPFHSPFRRYYIIRNCLYMFKESYIPIFFVLQQLLINVLHGFLIIFFAKKNKLDYLNSMLKGFWNGLKFF